MKNLENMKFSKFNKIFVCHQKAIFINKKCFGNVDTCIKQHDRHLVCCLMFIKHIKGFLFTS